MTAGELVSDDLVEEVVRERLDQHDWNYGFVIDGFPRNARQAEFFMENYDIDGVIHLEIPDEEVRRRVLSRRLCPNCGMDYNLIADRPEVEGRCDICGHELITRADDTPEALDARLRDYHAKTRPVLELFRRKETVFDVDARPDPRGGPGGHPQTAGTTGVRRQGLTAASSGRARWCAGSGSAQVVSAPLQLRLDRLAHLLDHREPCVVLVVAGDHVPGRPGRGRCVPASR